jgi:hypothetical protein
VTGTARSFMWTFLTTGDYMRDTHQLGS